MRGAPGRAACLPGGRVQWPETVETPEGGEAGMTTDEWLRIAFVAALIAGAVGVFLVAADGGDSTISGEADSAGAVSAAELGEQLQAAIADSQEGSDFTGVKCVERDENVFRCLGDYKPTVAWVRESMAGVDTSGFTERDWDALVDQQTGNVTFEVTVDPSDGTFIYEPQ